MAAARERQYCDARHRVGLLAGQLGGPLRCEGFSCSLWNGNAKHGPGSGAAAAIRDRIETGNYQHWDEGSPRERSRVLTRRLPVDREVARKIDTKGQ